MENKRRGLLIDNIKVSYDDVVLNVNDLKYNMLPVEGCPHFSEYKLARYACGFRNIYNAIPAQHADKFWATIPGITSESMYYRMKRGDKLIPPSIRQQILDSAHRLGVPEAVDFDGYCEVIEV